MVTATGRLSSTEPNLQNIPIRSEEGRLIRSCFIAGKGFEELMTADYSQIEMRIMAHLSNDKALLAALTSGEDLHTTVGAQVRSIQCECWLGYRNHWLRRRDLSSHQTQTLLLQSGVRRRT